MNSNKVANLKSFSERTNQGIKRIFIPILDSKGRTRKKKLCWKISFVKAMGIRCVARDANNSSGIATKSPAETEQLTVAKHAPPSLGQKRKAVHSGSKRLKGVVASVHAAERPTAKVSLMSKRAVFTRIFIRRTR